jgi:hypothetical protein
MARGNIKMLMVRKCILGTVGMISVVGQGSRF